MGKIIVPGRDNKDLSKVSHIALTCVPTPYQLKEVKGCHFNPPVTLNRDVPYLIVVSHQQLYVPLPGWYDIPEKGCLSWIARFQFVQVSQPSLVIYKAFVFRALEGLPPVDVDKNYKSKGGGLF